MGLLNDLKAKGTQLADKANQGLSDMNNPSSGGSKQAEPLLRDLGLATWLELQGRSNETTEAEKERVLTAIGQLESSQGQLPQTFVSAPPPAPGTGGPPPPPGAAAAPPAPGAAAAPPAPGTAGEAPPAPAAPPAPGAAAEAPPAPAAAAEAPPAPAAAAEAPPAPAPAAEAPPAPGAVPPPPGAVPPPPGTVGS